MVTRSLPISPVSLRLGALDIVTRPLPVSPVSLQGEGPRHGDQVTSHLLCVPPGRGSLTGDQATSCPESSKLAWVADWTVPRDGLAEASTGPIPATLCRRPCVSGGLPRTLWEPGSQCWPHHLRIPRHLLPGQSNGRARAQSPGNSGLPGEPLGDHRGDSAPSSALSPGWLVRCSCHQYHS